MRTLYFILFVSSLAIISCTKLDEETTDLVQILKQELQQLTTDPLSWSDASLGFLDPIADKSIIALGESTHGTSEFFKAKQRIFQYLVENHGYKIFAFEADFGESLLINEAVLNGNSGDIEDLMKSKMHFWTWKTKEVKDLLEWMCNYNLGKPEKDKVQYMGVDCQFNTFHPGMVMDYLEKTSAPYCSLADSILDKARSASEENFDSYTEETFRNYLYKLKALQDTVISHDNELIEASSEKEYELCVRILEVIRQVSLIRFYQTEDYSINYRDPFMAQNTAWLREYFDGKKIVLWAHNGHIANHSYEGGEGSMGYYLSRDLYNEYTTIGFLFSRGSFTAVGMDGEQYTGPEKQVIDIDPEANSMNAIMSEVKEPAFSVKISDLQQYTQWYDLFNEGIQYFQIGTVYNKKPEDYYGAFSPTLFDYLIFFNKTTASVLL